MEQHTQDAKDEVRKTVEEMKSLLDDVRGRLRDAGSDTKAAKLRFPQALEMISAGLPCSLHRSSGQALSPRL